MLHNKVALVTGGSSGIGRAVALVWAREGAQVVVSDTNISGGEETVKLVREQGGRAIFLQADVGQASDSKALVEQTVAYYGRLDVACNNAGIGGPSAPMADYPLDGWAEVININLSGVFFGMQQQIAAMLKSGGGAIVNMASILGAVGFATNSAYTAAKHGVVGLTQVAALEYSDKGIRINAVGPGFIHTPLVSTIEADPARIAQLVAAHPIGRLARIFHEGTRKIAMGFASESRREKEEWLFHCDDEQRRVRRKERARAALARKWQWTLCHSNQFEDFRAVTTKSGHLLATS